MTEASPAIARLFTLLLVLAGALLYQSFGYTEMAGSDMWWHLAAGREILQTKTLWLVDDWSYTAFGDDWLNHEWLSDLIFFAWVSVFGEEAIVYWKWLVTVATFLLLQRVLVRQSGSELAAYLCAGVAAAIAAPFIDVRPHLYSLLCFSLLLWLALGRTPRRWVLALLFLVWVNLHGGFFFGLMALGVLVFPWRNFSAEALKGAVLVGLACLAAATLNPSGVGTFLYPLKYAFDDSSPFRQLAEWMPPSTPGGIQSPLFFYFMWAPVAAVAYALPAVRRRVAVPWEGLLLAALTLAMALTSRRFIPLFAISLAVLLAPLLGLLLARLEKHALAVVLAVAALLFGAYRLLPYPLQAAPAFHYLTAHYSYPVDVVNLIEANGLRGRVFAFYNWGGYLHWRTDGGMKVFIDGRADTLYDADTYNDYVSILQSQPGWIELVESRRPDYILWPQARGKGQEKLDALRQTGRWRAVYRDAEGWLLARRDLALPEPMLGSPDTVWRDAGYAQINAWRGGLDDAIANAERARERMPWHRTACNVLSSAYRQRGEAARGDAVQRECWDIFPSRYLR